MNRGQRLAIFFFFLCGTLQEVQMYMTLETVEGFNKLLEDAGDKPVLIEFSDQRCSVCRVLAPKIQNLMETIGNGLFAMVDMNQLDRGHIGGTDEAKIREFISRRT